MNSWLRLLALCTLLLPVATRAELPARSYAQGEFSYATGPLPDYVQLREVAATWNAPSASLPGNWRNWLNDTQIDRRGPTRRAYYDRAYEPRSTEMVGQAAKYAIQFNPAYQKLIVHRVEVRRAGQWSNRFDAAKVSLARREERFEENMADGSVTAMLLLADVREGDVVRIAYSVEGSNPVLAGSDADSTYMAWIDPTLERSVRLLFPADAPPEVRSQGSPGNPRPRRVGDHYEVALDLHDVAGYPDEGDYPTWYERLPVLEVAPKRTWADVVAWALPLYPEAPLPADLEARLPEWSRIADPVARAFEVLRVVQREVRYFGTEMGDNTHRPTPPADTWAKRYGDCKDKAYLTATILRRLGIEAEPALASLGEGKGVGAHLPSAAAFDHVIVRARIDGKPYWLDATLAEQHGDLRKLDVRDYGLVLPVLAGSSALVPVLPPEGVKNTVELVESYFPSAADDSIDLRIDTTYTGLRAETMRYRFNARGLDEMGRDYSNFYRKRFSELEVAEPLKVEDAADSDRLVVHERYKLKNGWSFKLGNQRQIELYADALAGDAVMPSTLERKGPLAISGRSSLTHRIIVEVPKGWTLPEVPATRKAGTSEFAYVRSASAKGNRFEMEHRFDVLADDVSTAELPEYLREMRSVRDDMDLRVTMRASGATGEAERSERLQKLLRDAAKDNGDSK